MSTKKVIRDIPIGDPGRDVYAFRVGDTIDSALVEENGWHDYVAGPETKAAQKATAAAAGNKES